MSIETLMRVRGKNEFGPVVKEVQGQINSLDRSAQAVGSAIGGSLGGVIAGGVGALAVGVIVDTGVELAKLGAQAIRVEDGFRNLMQSIGSTSEEALGKLRAASLGTIDDTNLMISSNKAVMLGVGQSAEELSQLLSAAAARGRNLGIDTATAFDNIVTGIGRMSPLILDNLGILTGGEKAFEIYAKSIGKTAEQLSDAERKQFLINKVLSDATPLADDAAAAFERFAAVQVNFRTELGKSISAFADMSGITDILAGATSQLSVAAALNAARAEAGIGFLAAAYINLKVTLGQAITPTEEFALALQKVDNAFIEGVISEEEAKKQIADLTYQFYGAANAAGFMDQVLHTSAGSMAFMSVNAQNAVVGVSALANAVVYASGQMSQTYAPALEMWTGLIDRAKTSLQAAAIAKVPTLGVKGAREWFESRQEGLDDLAGSIEQVGDDAFEGELRLAKFNASLIEQAPVVKNASAALSGYNDALDRLRGSVESAIGGAIAGTKSLMDFSSEGMVGSFDPNGPARNFGRMWDLAKNGFNSQWLEPLRQEGLIPQDVIDQGEEALKRFAEGKARAFQAGTDLGMLDKGAIKAQVMQEIAAQAELARMRDEILRELSGQGVSRIAATGALDTVLGQQGMVPTGQAGASGYAEGFAGSLVGQGSKIVTVLATEIEENKGGFDTVGRSAGTFWGNGFLATVKDNVPLELVTLLVSLVTPGVMARIAQDQTRGGPVK